MFSQPESFFARLFIATVAALSTQALGMTSTSGLSVETIAERRVQLNGGVEYMAAEQLRVGDEIFYTVRVRNMTGSAVQDASVVKGVPRNTRYIVNSATGPAAAVDFSVDGGTTFASPEQLVVPLPGGGVRPATPDDYTHIRWRLRHPLAGGAIALLRFRAIFR
jgi:uncharacterized repeat protein (TIGR01451 family)